MKLWKQLVMSFVVALALPPLIVVVGAIMTGVGIGFLMDPMIYSLISPLSHTIFSDAITAYMVVIGIFLTNWLIVFLIMFLFTHLWRGLRAK